MTPAPTINHMNVFFFFFFFSIFYINQRQCWYLHPGPPVLPAVVYHCRTWPRWTPSSPTLRDAAPGNHLQGTIKGRNRDTGFQLPKEDLIYYVLPMLYTRVNGHAGLDCGHLFLPLPLNLRALARTKSKCSSMPVQADIIFNKHWMANTRVGQRGCTVFFPSLFSPLPWRISSSSSPASSSLSWVSASSTGEFRALDSEEAWNVNTYLDNSIDALRVEQNELHFADKIFKDNFLKGKFAFCLQFHWHLFL